MELRDYVKIIGKNWWAFIVIVILSVVFAFGFTKTRPVTYTSSTTFTVNKGSILKQSQANYYQFDNYYNIQSAGLFSQIVQLWFESPALVTEIYQKAGIPVPDVSQKELGKTFKAVRDEPAIINVSISGPDKDQLQKLMNSAYAVLQAKTNELGSNDTSFYQLTKFDPVVTKDQHSLLLNSVIGLLTGLILGVLVTFAIAYFKEDK